MGRENTYRKDYLNKKLGWSNFLDVTVTSLCVGWLKYYDMLYSEERCQLVMFEMLFIGKVKPRATSP